MRIAVLGHNAGANSWYRAGHPARTLAQRGHTVRYDNDAEPQLPLQLLQSCDAVLFYRDASSTSRALAKRLRTEGVAVLWDCDDLVGSLPPDHPGYREFGRLRGATMFREIAQMLRLAHVVTTPSEVLAQHYRELESAPCVRVVENCVPDEFATVARPPHQGVVVGWTASLEHQIDRDRLGLRAVLQSLLDTYPELRVVSIGISLGLPGVRFQNIRHVDFAQLGKVLAQLDVGLAPIVDIPMNNARSNGKVKEYAAAGTPWLASATGPYLGLGIDQGGELVSDDGWYEAIERLITNDRLRRKLAKRAARWGRDQTIGKNVEAWERVFEEAVERAREERGVMQLA